MKRIAKIVIFILVLLLVWELAIDQTNSVRLERNQTSIEAFLPAPSTILSVYQSDASTIVNELFVTLSRAGLGLVLGASLAWLFCLLFVIFPSLRTVGLSTAIAVNSFPVIGFAPAIVLLFGQGSWFSIVFVSMLITYFPILVTLDNAFRAIPRDFEDVLRVFSASRAQVITMLYFPLLLPEFVASLRLAIPAAIIGATIGEWLGTRSGIGHLVTISLYQLEPGMLYAALIALAGASLVCVGLLHVIERRIFPWREPIHTNL